MLKLSSDQLKEFKRLLNDISPENMSVQPSCSGQKQFANAMRQWKRLEKKIGRFVSEDEIRYHGKKQ